MSGLGSRSILSLAILVLLSAASGYPTVPVIINAPIEVSGDVCETLQYEFTGWNPEGDVIYIFKESGPGMVDSVSGVWTCQPSISDVGVPQVLALYARTQQGVTGPLTETAILIHNDPPQFTNCPTSVIHALQGYPRTIQLQTSGACPEDGSLFSIGESDSEGTYTVDSLDGRLVARAISGYSWVEVLLTDGDVAMSCYVELAVATTFCRGGQAGNVDYVDGTDLSDLIALVNYLFNSGEWVPAVLANVNGDPECLVDLSDLLHLVNYLFNGGPDPADCLLECEFVD